MLALRSVAERPAVLRFLRGLILSIGALVALSLWLPPAHAEGFFQKLFGWGSSRRAERYRAADIQFRFRRPALRVGPRLRSRLWRRRLAAGPRQVPDAVRAHLRRVLFPHRRQRRPRASASGCAHLLGALRRRSQAVLLSDQRRQRRHDGRHGRAAVRADAERVPLPQDAGAGLHVQTGAVVGGDRSAPPGLQGRGCGAGGNARRAALCRARGRSPATGGRRTATAAPAARSKPTCSARTTARSKPPGTAASAGTSAARV